MDDADPEEILSSSGWDEEDAVDTEDRLSSSVWDDLDAAAPGDELSSSGWDEDDATDTGDGLSSSCRDGVDESVGGERISSSSWDDVDSADSVFSFTISGEVIDFSLSSGSVNVFVGSESLSSENPNVFDIFSGRDAIRWRASISHLKLV